MDYPQEPDMIKDQDFKTLIFSGARLWYHKTSLMMLLRHDNY